MESAWFIHELTERTKWCAFPPIVCTATDGDNGGWFRNVEWASNYWGAFYRPFCQHARCDQAVVKPAFIDDYLDRHGAHGEVIVRTGAWNTGEHDGVGFVQWTGSRMQQDARKRVAEVSKRIHGARRDAAQRGWPDPDEGNRNLDPRPRHDRRQTGARQEPVRTMDLGIELYRGRTAQLESAIFPQAESVWTAPVDASTP